MYVYINMYIYNYILYDNFYFVMMRCHEDTVMLRSTMSSYERPVIEVVYGETMIHSLEAIVVGF